MLKKFDAIDYLVKKYVDDGKHATIPVYLSNKEKFFSQYDPTDTAISSSLAEYLNRCSYNIPTNYKIVVDVVCNDLDDETKEKMSEAIKNHYGVLMFDNNIDLKDNIRKSVALFVMGLLFVFLVYVGNFAEELSIFLGTTMNILKEILTITGWVFIWYSLEKLFFERTALFRKRTENAQMFNAKVIFENEKEYYKILEKESKEVVQENKDYEEIRESFLEQ